MIRNRPEARWLPSRFRFATFRLYALGRLTAARRKVIAAEAMALVIDPDQSFDQYVVAIWIYVTTTLYIGALLPLHPAIALIAALVSVPLLLQIPLLVVFGLLLPKWRNNQAAGTLLLMSILLLASLGYIRSESWARPVAWSFVGALAVNTLASLLVRLLRKRIARIEAEYVQS